MADRSAFGSACTEVPTCILCVHVRDLLTKRVRVSVHFCARPTMEKGSQCVGINECKSETVAIPPIVDRSSAPRPSMGGFLPDSWVSPLGLKELELEVRVLQQSCHSIYVAMEEKLELSWEDLREESVCLCLFLTFSQLPRRRETKPKQHWAWAQIRWADTFWADSDTL